MNERISLQDLVDLLAKKQEITKKDAESFLRELFAIVTENIEAGESVKIKDFGTFKLVKVNARKSVDVNTGEAIEIAAHYKLSFNPDKSLKEAVNRPFAHFESVVLEEGVNFDNIENEVVIEGDDVDEDVTVEEDITEYIDVEPPVSEVIEEKTVVEEKKVAEAEPIEPEIVAAEETIEEVTEEEPEKEIIEESNGKVANDLSGFRPDPIFVPIEEIAPAEDKKKDLYDDLPRFEPIEPLTATESEAEDDDDDDDFIDEKPKRRDIRKRYISLAFFVFLIIAGFVIGGLYFERIATFLTEGSTANGGKAIVMGESETIPEENIPVVDSLAENTDTLKVQEINKPDEVRPVDVPVQKAEAKNKTKEVKAPDVPIKVEQETTDLLAVEIIETGHTLRNISLKYYGNRSFWVYIYEENKEKIKNPNSIPLGTKLKIPLAAKYGIDPRNSESVKKARKIEEALFSQMGI